MYLNVCVYMNVENVFGLLLVDDTIHSHLKLFLFHRKQQQQKNATDNVLNKKLSFQFGKKTRTMEHLLKINRFSVAQRGGLVLFVGYVFVGRCCSQRANM